VDDRAQWGTLMAAAQQGDARAYRALLGELRPWLFGYYRRRLIPAQVEDAVQDALIARAALRRLGERDRALQVDRQAARTDPRARRRNPS